MQTKCPFENFLYIRSIPLFADLHFEELHRIATYCKSKSYVRKSFIFQEGDSTDTLYILKSGIVKVGKLSDDGKEQIMRLIFPGDLFGFFFILPDQKHYLNAVVIDDADVLYIHKTDFVSLLEQNKEMAYRYVLALTERLYQADVWTGMLSLSEVENRIAKLLLYFHQKTGFTQESFQLPIEKKEFASYIGTTAETLSRKLAQFEALGLLTLEGRKAIRIRNVCRLEQLAQNV